MQADVSDEADAQAMVDRAVEAFGRVDVLYNNAGIMPAEDHSVIDTDVATWDRVMAVNVRGVFLGCKHAIPRMVEQGSGSVINVASFVAILGCSVPQDAYTASKGAILALTRSLAVQFGPHGVRSNSLSPGPVETPLLLDWLVKDEEAKRIRLARNPTGRFGKPEEIVDRGALPRLGRVPLDERRELRHRRRHHRQLLLSVTLSSVGETGQRRLGAARMVVGGQLVDAADGRTAEVVDPAHGVTLATVPVGGAEDVDRAVDGSAGGPRGSLVADLGR